MKTFVILRLLLLIGLLALGSVAGVQAQDRAQPGRVEIPAQQLPSALKVAVRERPHAELKVAHVAHTPAPAKEDQSIAIEIKVENEGTAPSSGEDILHFDCKNQQPTGPACPFGPGQRSLPVIHSLKEPYPSGPYAHSVQLLTTPTWEPGTYEVRAWIVAPGSQFSETFLATIDVKPKLQIGPVAASNQAKTAIVSLGLPDLAVMVDHAGIVPKVTVKNQGGKASGGTTVRLICLTYDGTQWMGYCPGWFGTNGAVEGSIPSLDPGEGLSIPAPTSGSCLDSSPGPPEVDTCKVTVVVDPGSNVAEIYETNNTASYELEPPY